MTLSPPRKELTKKFNLLKKHYIDPFFKKYGFEKGKGEYVKKGENLSWTLNIQKASWDSEGVLSFALNWGLYIPGYRTFYDRLEDDLPGGILGARVGILTNDRDKWWEIKSEDQPEDLDKCGQEVSDLLETEFVEQLINKIHTLDDVIEFISIIRERSRGRVVVCAPEKATAHLAVLYFLKGNTKKALEMADELIAIVKWPHLKGPGIRLKERLIEKSAES